MHRVEGRLLCKAIPTCTPIGMADNRILAGMAAPSTFRPLVIDSRERGGELSLIVINLDLQEESGIATDARLKIYGFCSSSPPCSSLNGTSHGILQLI